MKEKDLFNREKIYHKVHLVEISPKYNYCDKGGHRERSIYHQSNHLKHWNKEKNRHDLSLL